MSETIAKHVGQPSEGMMLELSTDGGTVWVEVSELVSMDYYKSTMGKVPASTLNTAGRTKRKRPGWSEAQDLKVQVALTKAQLVVLAGHYDDRQELQARQTYPDDYGGLPVGAWVFPCFISELSAGTVKAETDELIMVDFTLCVTGAGVFTPAA